jgi:hypothetical protein
MGRNAYVDLLQTPFARSSCSAIARASLGDSRDIRGRSIAGCEGRLAASRGCLQLEAVSLTSRSFIPRAHASQPHTRFRDDP